MKPGPTESTEPFSGLLAMPISCTESPSGSMPDSGTSMRTVSPASTRAVTRPGVGALFVAASTSRTDIVTRACAVWPSGPAIE